MYSPTVYPATFVGGPSGSWRVDRVIAIRGDSLPFVERLEVHAGVQPTLAGTFVLRGVAGHARYVERHEKVRLDAVSPPLGRVEATCAALIPITKSPAWWALPQDERRAIFETRSHHIADSMAYLPRVARRLYHARELGEAFDFLTWFEFAPEHAGAFDELLGILRSREEWAFVVREVEIRLLR
jgi:chlorite dismutase